MLKTTPISVLALVLLPGLALAAGETIRISTDSLGVQGNTDSSSASISANGRYIVFMSWSNNLVSGDTNGGPDIFVRDRQTGATVRVSVDSAGGESNGYSYTPSISADGRYVAFSSTANNLVAGDNNARRDIFIHDRQTGQTTLVNVNNLGAQGDSDSYTPAISADGRHVAFLSDSSNLVDGDTNDMRDVFARDRLLQASTQTDVSLAVSGTSSAVKGSDAAYNLSVTNNGSINAANTSLTGVISNHGKLKSIVPSQGKCTLSAVPICRFGTLLPGQSATVLATVRLTGRTTIKAAAQAAPKTTCRRIMRKTSPPKSNNGVLLFPCIRLRTA